MKKSLFLFVLLSLLSLPMQAQEAEPEAAVEEQLTDPRDSVINALTRQIQEMRLTEILMQEQLEQTAMTAREDSLRKIHRQQRIDSLRQVTPGVPVIVDEDTLLLLYASRGGATPERRAKEAIDKIEKLGKSLTFNIDSMYVFDSELSSDIMSGDVVLLSLSDLDGMWQGKTRGELAEDYLGVIRAKVEELQEDYGLRAKLMGVLFAVLIIIVQIILIRLTLLLFRRLYKRIVWAMRTWIRPFVFKGYELLNTRNAARILLLLARILFWIVVLLQLFISIPLLFSIFPETQELTYKLLGYVWNPLKDIGLGIVAYIPNLIKIVIIIICFRYLIRGIRYVANEVAEGHIKLDGFYADWAMPTFQILRALIWCFAVVMIWPLLPSSDSEVFKGVSVFVGLVFSLGSTAIVGNIVSGIVITYMRPFKIGDFVKINGIEGEVVEKTAFVTRLRTMKNEIVTVPNSAIMSSEAVNYSSAAEQRKGVIIHTEVTIGYGVPRETVENLLLDAALSCTKLQKKPAPFVRIRALEDFYVRYEINAYTLNSLQLSACYSELHKAILDHFFEAGVEIMSPHFKAERDGNPVEIPESYLDKEKAKEE
ncbi:MAG: mechanosensitive ion channel family protein [Bacteroidaceae bacterium]|nr:mechanosensitive ion channel family protein [Bacteroidaceae bacterium]